MNSEGRFLKSVEVLRGFTDVHHDDLLALPLFGQIHLIPAAVVLDFPCGDPQWVALLIECGQSVPTLAYLDPHRETRARYATCTRYRFSVVETSCSDEEHD